MKESEIPLPRDLQRLIGIACRQEETRMGRTSSLAGRRQELGEAYSKGDGEESISYR